MKYLFFALIPLLFFSCEQPNSESLESEKGVKGIDSSDFESEPKPTLTFAKLSEGYLENEILTINNERDTLLKGKKGTEIFIPAGSLIPGGRNVKLEVKECYNISDFVKHNLTTTSNGKLLGSNGMIYLNVVGNDSTTINPKKPIKIKFPSSKSESSDLFYGTRDDQGNIEWGEAQNQETTTAEKSLRPNLVSNRPQNLTQEMPENFFPPYPFYSAFCVKCLDTLKSFIAFPPLITRSRMTQSVYVDIEINRMGEIEDVKLVKGINSEIDKMVIDAIKKLNLFVPAIAGSYYSLSTLRYEIKFNGEKQEIEWPLTMLWNNRKEEIYNHWRKKRIEFENEAKSTQEFLDNMDTEVRGQIENVKKESVRGYIFKVANLGWINCDYFIRPANSKLFVKSDNPYADVMLTFNDDRKRGFKGTMRGVFNYQDQQFEFKNIPSNYDATLLSIAENNGPVFGSVKVNGAKDSLISIQHKSISYAELKEIIENL